MYGWTHLSKLSAEVITQLKEQNSIESLCISALYGGTGAMCGEDMTPIRPAIIWMDLPR